MRSLVVTLAMCTAFVWGCGETQPPQLAAADTQQATPTPRPSTASRPAIAVPTPTQGGAGVLNATVNVYEYTQVKRFGPDSELATLLTSALQQELSRGVHEDATYFRDPGRIQGYVDVIKRDRFYDGVQEGIELSFPKPGISVANATYTRIFVPYNIGTVGSAFLLPSDVADRAYRVLLLLGNERYEREVATHASPPGSHLRTQLDAAFLLPSRDTTPPLSPKQDAGQLGEVAEDFLQAMILSAQLQEKRDVSNEYALIAQRHLTPELVARANPSSRSGLLLPKSVSEPVQIGWPNHPTRIQGDRGWSANVISGEPKGRQRRHQCVHTMLERREGAWRISQIETHELRESWNCSSSPQR